MRVIALLPLLLVTASFVLSLLCILAGLNSGFMENFEQITFNTSELGRGIINKVVEAEGINPNTTVPTSALSNIPPSATSAVPAALQSEIAGQTYETIIEQIAQDLNISDFYKIHILSYCQGEYEPNPLSPSALQNVTYCSPPQAFSFFNATQVLQNSLKSTIPFSSIQWPSEIEDAIDAMEVVQKVQFVLYCVGTGFAGLSLLEAILAFLLDGRFSAICNVILDIIAFIALVIASGCATGFIIVVQNAVNNYGAQVDVQAYKGVNFLVITWIATVLPLIASILWCIDFCVGPDRRRRNKW